MKRTAILAAFIGVLASVVTLMWAGPYTRSRHGAGASPVSNPPVGTAGREGADEQDDSPATLHDLETVTGTVDPHELIGRRVDFHVNVADVNDDMSFWVGNKDNRLLVVLAHSPSVNDIKSAAPGQIVHITGTIEGMPFKDQSKDQKVYIRADHVRRDG